MGLLCSTFSLWRKYNYSKKYTLFLNRNRFWSRNININVTFPSGYYVHRQPFTTKRDCTVSSCILSWQYSEGLNSWIQTGFIQGFFFPTREPSDSCLWLLLEATDFCLLFEGQSQAFQASSHSFLFFFVILCSPLHNTLSIHPSTLLWNNLFSL